ncbi:MAG TPA: lipopolysaccharide transport periplasmic protein LptA [Rhizomicrobium sp.]|jgi:lipopolysaccharide export system protein LptA
MKGALFVLAFFFVTPAFAAAPPSVMGRHDSNAPINISADKFVADSNAKSGTWTGNVIVIQGDMRMRANSVRLNVVGKENKPDKIFANGNVVVDSPNSGTVTGDNGVYDVVARTVTMTGKVVLTKQKDVMRGSPLTVNLDSGVATLGGGTKSTPSQNGGRVQGIFTPPPSSNPPQQSPN